jgi:hypothetical protein
MDLNSGPGTSLELRGPSKEVVGAEVRGRHDDKGQGNVKEKALKWTKGTIEPVKARILEVNTMTGLEMRERVHYVLP